MSRDIPQDQPLTDADRSYLMDRGAWGQALMVRIDENYPAEEPVVVDLEEGDGTGEEDGDEETVDYSSWTKAELTAEIKARNALGGPQLSLAGTAADLASRLQDADTPV